MYIRLVKRLFLSQGAGGGVVGEAGAFSKTVEPL